MIYFFHDASRPIYLLMVYVGGNVNTRALAAAAAFSFGKASYFQVGLICLLAPVFMAGAIAQEANPRTWDILLTTPMSAGDRYYSVPLAILRGGTSALDVLYNCISCGIVNAGVGYRATHDGDEFKTLLDESKELEFRAFLRFNPPKQESSKRIPLHQAVEQPADLFGLPDKFPLNCRQHVVVLADRIEQEVIDFVPDFTEVGNDSLQVRPTVVLRQPVYVLRKKNARAKPGNHAKHLDVELVSRVVF